MSREGEEIGKHKIAKVFRDRGSQTRLRSQSISGDAESLNSHFQFQIFVIHAYTPVKGFFTKRFNLVEYLYLIRRANDNSITSRDFNPLTPKI